MAKKGKSVTNVGKDGLIETLVIQSGDLVQVVAKGVTLHSDGVGGNITGNEEEAAEQTTAPCSESQIPNTEKPKGGLMDKRHVQQSRYVGCKLILGKIVGEASCRGGRIGRAEFPRVKAEIVEEALNVQWTPGMRLKMAVEAEVLSRMTWFPGTVPSVCAPDAGFSHGSLGLMLLVCQYLAC